MQYNQQCQKEKFCTQLKSTFQHKQNHVLVCPKKQKRTTLKKISIKFSKLLLYHEFMLFKVKKMCKQIILKERLADAHYL